MESIIRDPAARKWAYGVIAAGLVVASGYGLIEDGRVDNWLFLATAVLGVAGPGLAAANTPKRGDIVARPVDVEASAPDDEVADDEADPEVDESDRD